MHQTQKTNGLQNVCVFYITSLLFIYPYAFSSHVLEAMPYLSLNL